MEQEGVMENICKNCKYCKKVERHDLLMCNFHSWKVGADWGFLVVRSDGTAKAIPHCDILVKQDFGCNKFEPKD